IFEGLRPGEALALRWGRLAGDSIRVEERVYKRVLNTPKNGKPREGAISEGTLALIKEWAELAEDPSPDGFVFPSEKLSTPLSLDNLWGATCTRSWRKPVWDGRRFRCSGKQTRA